MSGFVEFIEFNEITTFVEFAVERSNTIILFFHLLMSARIGNGNNGPIKAVLKCLICLKNTPDIRGSLLK